MLALRAASCTSGQISRLAAAPDFPFDPDLLRHVSPIEWKNVILYGMFGMRSPPTSSCVW